MNSNKWTQQNIYILSRIIILLPPKEKEASIHFLFDAMADQRNDSTLAVFSIGTTYRSVGDSRAAAPVWMMGTESCVTGVPCSVWRWLLWLTRFFPLAG